MAPRAKRGSALDGKHRVLKNGSLELARHRANECWRDYNTDMLILTCVLLAPIALEIIKALVR